MVQPEVPARPTGRRWLRTAALTTLLVLLVVAFGAAGAFALLRSRVRLSLPQIDGTAPLAGLSAPVRVDRDALGIPTLYAFTRADAARALGYVHGQDRFFQMDLARRRAAGELSALVGSRALAVDRDIRPHRFRFVARRAWDLTTGRDREVLQAYAQGVNAGWRSRQAPPFEYLALQVDPDPWRPEDSYLTVLSMFITLQESGPAYERSVGLLHDTLPPALADFLAPRGTDWDTPIAGAPIPTPPIPGPEVLDLRKQNRGNPETRNQEPETRSRKPSDPLLASLGIGETDPLDAPALGSNNWAVAGSLTPDGAALVANDMHLAIRVPNTWYRAVVSWQTGSGTAHRVMGVTLPGVPVVVVGSNEHVAWAFTNTNGDWSDWVVLEPDPRDPDGYLTPDGPRRFEHHAERIRVKGEADVVLDVKWTVWGPVLDRDQRGRERALRWVAHDGDRLPGLTRIESAETLEELFDAANGMGTPDQNMIAADRSGRIGWTVFGSIPRRVGFDGQRPSSWADGSHRWDGYLSKEEYPRIIAPANGRLWTANARVGDGDLLAKIGDANYDVGIRARLIRDRLLAQDRFTPKDMLSIQLEDRALFLERWRDLVLGVLTPSATAARPPRAEFRTAVERTWTGRASIDSAAYRLVREFRFRVLTSVMGTLTDACRRADERFALSRRAEGPLWALVTARPPHLLDPAYKTWEDQLLAAVDATIAQMQAEGHGGPLAARTWGERNVAAIRHPLSGAIPFLSGWLDMPATPLPGDSYTPRMHTPTEGPSERMVVSPGHEAVGIMHMPTGQSGHPASPFYRAGHEAWVRGEPTPFLPGPTEHTLTLRP